MTYGQEVDLLATVKGDGHSGTPTGTVAFTVSGQDFDANCDSATLRRVDDNTATASCDTVLLPTGQPTTVTGTYSGDTTYAGSHGTFDQVVNKATPTFTVTSQTVTYGATSITLSGRICVEPNGPCPPMNEQVTITIQGLTPKIATISDDQGHFSVNYPLPTNPLLPAGTYPITYSYAGDSNFNSASDANTHLTVNKATPTFTVTSQTVTYGATSVTLSGTICAQPNGPCPPMNEQVSVTVQGLSAQPAAINDNQGHFSVSYQLGANPLLAAGTYTVTYTYAGDSNFNSASNTNTHLTVSKATPTVIVTSDNNPSIYGQTVDFTANVSGVPGGTTPTGAVTFTDNGSQIAHCIGLTLNNGTATCTTGATQQNLLLGGSHVIKANYSDDANYGPASGTLSPNQQVNRATPTVTVSSDDNPSRRSKRGLHRHRNRGYRRHCPHRNRNLHDNGSQIAACIGLILSMYRYLHHQRRRAKLADGWQPYHQGELQ